MNKQWAIVTAASLLRLAELSTYLSCAMFETRVRWFDAQLGRRDGVQVMGVGALLTSLFLSFGLALCLNHFVPFTKSGPVRRN